MSEIPFGKAPRPSIDFGSTTKDENDQPCCAGCSPDVLVDDARPSPDITVGGDGTRYVTIQGPGEREFAGSFTNQSTGQPVEYTIAVDRVDIAATTGVCRQDSLDNCTQSVACQFILTYKFIVTQSFGTLGSNGSNILTPTVSVQPSASSSGRPTYGNIGNGRFVFDDNGNMSGYRWDSFVQKSLSIDCGASPSSSSFVLVGLSVPASVTSICGPSFGKLITLICTACYGTSSEV